MGIFRRGAGFLALAALLLPAGVGARADELLVMPFACSMVGGRPLLSPAPEQSHRIIGQREQRTFNACSPVNPDMCRSWTVHRFALECEGARVAWVEVVAAAEAEQRGRRAWLENGRLRLRMEAAWTLEPDDPCAQPAPWFDRQRMRRYCAERRATEPPPIVEMPVGFAPMLGIDGIFVKAAPTAGAPIPPPPIGSGPPVAMIPPPGPPAAVTPPPPKVARADPPQPPRPEPSARTEPPKDVPAKDAAPKEASAKTPPPPVAPPPASQPAPKVAAPAPSPAASATPPAAKAGGPVIPKIINRPEPAAEAPAPALSPPEAAKTVPATPEPDSKSAASTPAPKEAPRQEPPQTKTAAEIQERSITVNVLSVVGSPATAIAFAFIALTAGLLTVFAVARRREHANAAGRKPRDFATVSLDGRGKRAKPAPARIGNARGKLPPNAAASAMNRVPMPGEGEAAGSGLPSHLGDRIPSTRMEALQVLGMGVTPSANDAALKKIVDGLRLSWHPDLAQDEADRQRRELRLKQINAAWEIIQGKRGEV